MHDHSPMNAHPEALFDCAILTVAWAGFLAYGAAALVTVADVLARRVGLAVPGVVDLVQLLVLAGAWLVMPYAFWSGAHVLVDLLLGRIPERARLLLARASALLAALLLAPMLWKSWQTYGQQHLFGDRSQQIGIPTSWYWLPLLFVLILRSRPPTETPEPLE